MRKLFFLFIVLIATGCNKGKIRELEEEISVLKNTVQKLNESLFQFQMAQSFKNYIDINNRNFQVIEDSFFHIAIKDVQEHLSGLKIKGEIMNVSSIKCTVCKFIFSSEKEIQEITINQITGGHATKFEVYIPNMPKDTKYVKVVAGEMMMHFQY